jgi:hypothetical protein
MTVHRYPFLAIRADLVRAALGLALCGIPLALKPAPFIAWTLGPAAVLFAFYGLKTIGRHFSRVTVSDERIVETGWRGSVDLPWASMADVGLHYFPARRDGGEGWMQLRLRGPAGTLRLESTLDGFHDIVRRAVRAAAARGLGLDPATASNLAKMGLAGDDDRG